MENKIHVRCPDIESKRGTKMNPKFYVKKAKFAGRCQYCGAPIAENEDVGLQKRSTGGWNVACMKCLDVIESSATPPTANSLETLGAMMHMLETTGSTLMADGFGKALFEIDPELGAALGEAFGTVMGEGSSTPEPAKHIPLRTVVKQRALL